MEIEQNEDARNVLNAHLDDIEYKQEFECPLPFNLDELNAAFKGYVKPPKKQ